MQATYLKGVLQRKTTLNDYDSLYEGAKFLKAQNQEEGKVATVVFCPLTTFVSIVHEYLKVSLAFCGTLNCTIGSSTTLRFNRV